MTAKHMFIAFVLAALFVAGVGWLLEHRWSMGNVCADPVISKRTWGIGAQCPKVNAPGPASETALEPD